MAVTVTLTTEQADWLVKHIDSLQGDWHWNSRTRPDADAQEHATTIKRKIESGLASSEWRGPGDR